MAKHCSTVEQGYPTLRTLHDCALSHTGQDLWSLLLLGLILLFVGAVVLAVAKR